MTADIDLPTGGMVDPSPDPDRTIEYGYAESGWKDQLTSYKGEEITYDAIGNPLTYRDGMTLTWEGRQLSSLIKSGTTSTYKYDADGLRTKKTVGNIATVYQYVNGQLLRERRSNGVVLRYAYDSLGNLATIQYTNIDNWTRTYYVRTKINGDVDQIYDTSGNLIAKYTYDAWGNTISITDADGNAITASTHVAVANPIRYRGYYWDAETGFYYLQSRYYDTTTKRFINADEMMGVNAGAAYNLYAYCGNNSVNMIDSVGMYPIEVGENPDAIVKDYSGLRYALSKKKSGAGDVPHRGDPGTTSVSPDGTKERVYGEDGLPSRDRHHTDHGNPAKHPYVPHDHDWGYDENGNWTIKQPGYPSRPGPLQPQEPLNTTLSGTDIASSVTVSVVVVVIYQVVKWGIAVALAPGSGGTSLAGAAVSP